MPEGDFGICSTNSSRRTFLYGATRRGDEGHQLLRRRLALRHDERLRHLAGRLVGAGDHRGVGDRGVGEQDRLQFGRGDLVALVLDQLLEPVDDREPAVRVGNAEVAGVQPPLGVDRLRRGLGPVEVALHDERPAHADLARSVPAARSSPVATSTILHSVLGTGGPADPGRSSPAVGTMCVTPPSVSP